MLAELHPRLPSLVERSASWVARRRKPATLMLGAAFAAAILVLFCSRMEADAPLFDADLHAAQALEVENALTLWGEAFHANAQGTQVYVAASRRRDLLLRLTLAGLPRRYIPTSADVLADQANALTPQSIIDDRRRSGIEGDLVSGLRRIGGVADAAVVLPPAPDDLFGNDTTKSPASAGVQIVMQPGEHLSGDAILGIKRFVAAAYPGLAPERVTVVDGSGAVQGTSAPPDRALSKERRVQSAVQSALDAVLGTGTAVVRVSVRTAGIEQQTQTTRIVPHGELSTDVGRERGSETGRTYDKERTVRRFAYDTLSERRSTPADAQTRISVAVFLDSRRVDGKAGPPIASLVRASAGADLKMGDEVVVQAVAFASPLSPPAVAVARPPATVGRRVLYPAAVACAVAFFGLASLPRAGRQSAITAAVAPPHRPAPRAIDPAAAALSELLAGESPQAAAYVLAEHAASVRDDVLNGFDPERGSAIRRFLELYARD